MQVRKGEGRTISKKNLRRGCTTATLTTCDLLCGHFSKQELPRHLSCTRSFEKFRREPCGVPTPCLEP